MASMPIDPILVEAQARGFYRAFRLMKSHLWPPGLPAGVTRLTGGDDVVPPMVVCLAFACELMLKALLAQHGKHAQREHSLSTLVGLLPPEERECLMTHMGSAAARFDEQIAEHAQAFKTWRYVYEPPGTATADDDFLDSLYTAAVHCAHPGRNADDFPEH